MKAKSGLEYEEKINHGKFIQVVFINTFIFLFIFFALSLLLIPVGLEKRESFKVCMIVAGFFTFVLNILLNK